MTERATTLVAVHDLPVDALIGVNPDEQDRRQRLIVSVEVMLDETFPTRLDQTIDYCAIAAAAQRLGEHHIGLIEDYARQLAEHCLTMGAAASASVTVIKPGALAAGQARTTVRLERPAPSNVLRLPLRDNGGARRLRFAFKPGIGGAAQRMLARFADQLVASVHGVEATTAVLDAGDGVWEIELALDPRQAPSLVRSGRRTPEDGARHEERGS